MASSMGKVSKEDMRALSMPSSTSKFQEVLFMGFRVRKSINLGGGFQVDLSKSGVGYSWGVPGYRIRIEILLNFQEKYSM